MLGCEKPKINQSCPYSQVSFCNLVYDKFWVDIFKLKYKDLNAWNCFDLNKSFWLYKSLCKTAKSLRSCGLVWYHFVNDPWSFDVPLALKPTYIDMIHPVESLSLQNLINGNFLDVEENLHFLCRHLECDRLSKLVFIQAISNRWV